MTQQANPPAKPPENPPNTTEMVRVNAHVTAAEHQKLKIYAAKKQTTISDLLREYIKSIPEQNLG